VTNSSLLLRSHITMAGLEGLASAIYHEKQQDGSMLCAQHALNSLLRTSCFIPESQSAVTLISRGTIRMSCTENYYTLSNSISLSPVISSQN